GLTGLEGDSTIIRLFKPSSLSAIISAIGILLLLFAKQQKKKDIASILLGFGVLMYGMTIMSDAVSPLADIPEFSNIMAAFSNPFLGIVIGALLTAVLQSSSASIGILQAVAMTGKVTYGMALPLILGQNIGSCITALVSCVGTNKNAKRAAMIHLYFNVIGTLLFLTVFYVSNVIFKYAFVNTQVTTFGIAVVHTVFNIANTIILFPFGNLLAKLAKATIRDKDEQDTENLLDDRFLNIPSFAIEQCHNLTLKMSDLSKNTLLLSMDALNSFTYKISEQVIKNEDIVDKYEDKLGTYLCKLSSKELSEKDSNEVSKLLHTIGDFERISDHAVNLIKAAEELYEKKLTFSLEAQSEIAVITSALREILAKTFDAFEKDDLSEAVDVEPLEQVIDKLTEGIKLRHIERLKQGKCTIELGFILTDLLADYERVSDHCSNIAACLIQTHDSSYSIHTYLNTIKSGESHFVTMMSRYSDKYSLPDEVKTEAKV
ncbi:MAG TPA: Na/Pi cotransporter family protein, partial [Bacillota bacterium]|nr:Na/Pi cotransporter family protein [Bacillota bacterium]